MGLTKITYQLFFRGVKYLLMNANNKMVIFFEGFPQLVQLILIHDTIIGGENGQPRKGKTKTQDILRYDPKWNEWVKVGDLCRPRTRHGVSLVPADMADYCILDLDC